MVHEDVLSITVLAKTCTENRNERNDVVGLLRPRVKVAYVFSEHSICVDRKEIILAQMLACQKLLKYATDEPEKQAVEKEISDLQLALDLVSI